MFSILKTLLLFLLLLFTNNSFADDDNGLPEVYEINGKKLMDGKTAIHIHFTDIIEERYIVDVEWFPDNGLMPLWTGPAIIIFNTKDGVLSLFTISTGFFHIPNFKWDWKKISVNIGRLILVDQNNIEVQNKKSIVKYNIETLDSQRVDLRGMRVDEAIETLDIFIDEDIEYAQRLSQAGIPVELHVYPGAFHGSNGFVAESPLSVRWAADQSAALETALNPAS